MIAVEAAAIKPFRGAKLPRVLLREGERVRFNGPNGVCYCYKVVGMYRPLQPDRKIVCGLYAVGIVAITDANVRPFGKIPSPRSLITALLHYCKIKPNVLRIGNVWSPRGLK